MEFLGRNSSEFYSFQMEAYLNDVLEGFAPMSFWRNCPKLILRGKTSYFKTQFSIAVIPLPNSSNLQMKKQQTGLAFNGIRINILNTPSNLNSTLLYEIENKLLKFSFILPQNTFQSMRRSIK